MSLILVMVAWGTVGRDMMKPEVRTVEVQVPAPAPAPVVATRPMPEPVTAPVEVTPVERPAPVARPAPRATERRPPPAPTPVAAAPVAEEPLIAEAPVAVAPPVTPTVSEPPAPVVPKGPASKLTGTGTWSGTAGSANVTFDMTVDGAGAVTGTAKLTDGPDVLRGNVRGSVSQNADGSWTVALVMIGAGETTTYSGVIDGNHAKGRMFEAGKNKGRWTISR
jgi:hypothetical protein